MRSATFRLLIPATLLTLATSGGEVWAQSEFVIGTRPAVVKNDPSCYANTGRFRGCDNGTVIDQVTGLVWLQRANCIEVPGTGGNNLTDWATAMAGVAALADGFCNLSDGSQRGDWRLPTSGEWEATIGYVRDVLMCGGPFSPLFPNDAGTGCYSYLALFPNIQGLARDDYWTSTVNGFSPSMVRIADLVTGVTHTSIAKADTARIWAVRDPD